MSINFELTPSQKRILVLGTVILCVIGIVSLVDSNHENPKSKNEQKVSHVLTDINTREIGIESMAASLKY
ncbi:MAG: hypothetical protein ACI4V7_03060, partial [Succinivibrionaceae bacterium]